MSKLDGKDIEQAILNALEERDQRKAEIYWEMNRMVGFKEAGWMLKATYIMTYGLVISVVLLAVWMAFVITTGRLWI